MNSKHIRYTKDDFKYSPDLKKKTKKTIFKHVYVYMLINYLWIFIYSKYNALRQGPVFFLQQDPDPDPEINTLFF